MMEDGSVKSDLQSHPNHRRMPLSQVRKGKNPLRGKKEFVRTLDSAQQVVKKYRRSTDGDESIKVAAKKREIAQFAASSQSKKMKSNTEQSESQYDQRKASNPYIDAEDKEIARLEKLMGIKGGKSGSKTRCAEKLNKEYELFEGIGSNFGDFLMDLDDLTEMIEGRGSKKQVFASDVDGDANSDDESPDVVMSTSHLIADDEQEQSDLEAEIESDSEEESDGEESESVNAIKNDQEMSKEFEESDERDGDETTGGEDDDAGREDNSSAFTYKPSEGEDIYGRSTGKGVTSSQAGGKYVPPGKRILLLTAIDESSEAVKTVRRQMNGLLNRLSDQSKDSVVRALKNVFDANSLSVANTVLKDCVMDACSNPSQLMTSLIPIYAAMIAALHLAVGADVGAFIIETLAKSLHAAIEEERKRLSVLPVHPKSDQHKYISSKLSNNALLLLVYLYNLRVLHHTLIMDLMTLLAGSFQNLPSAESSSIIPSATSTTPPAIGELEVDLLVCLVDHCGSMLRADDPLGLKTAIATLNKRSAAQVGAGQVVGSTRLKFMLETLSDLRNNKSRRTQSANADVVKSLRQWLGGVKNTLGGGRAGADLCLRVSLFDLLDAEKSGRWWKAGASWAGKKSGIITSAGDDSDEEQDVSTVTRQKGNPEEEKLLLLAKKMRFNTSTRRNIFVVIMSSRDVDDAFERLMRLQLRGKQDREVVRVITECCAQEKTYNPFYSELAAMLCAHNRQYKTSLQFIFWDNFKLFEDEVAGRRTVNLARFLSRLVTAFHLPLAVLKPIDMTDINSNMMLFLATFFMAIFSAKISEETFQTLLDRVATTKDFSTVRDNVLYFLQSHLQKIPVGLDPSEAKAMERRRKVAVKTMEAMSVLDMAAGAMEQEEQDDMGAAAEKRSKRSM